MTMDFHIDKTTILFLRFLVIICGFFLLAACGTSGTEKNCENTGKEESDMTPEIGSSARNAPSINILTPAPVGQETAIFGLG
jgi:hypothetical protein